MDLDEKYWCLGQEFVQKTYFFRILFIGGGGEVDFIPYDYFLAANLGHQLRYH